jgi:rSAM/selenodomain-associated transferase 1
VKRQVLLVAKAPLPGRSKTRLVPPLTNDQAASLHRALLLDTLEACRAEVPQAGLLYVDESDVEELMRLAGEGTPLVPQEGRGLEAALSCGMARLLPDGPTALVSSDIPGIPRGSLGRAFAALEDGADVVLGPAFDGGYWLIAMREYREAAFRGIPWSTPAVYATTLRRCRDARLRVRSLEPWRDVDTAADLDTLLEEADRLPAPHTVGLLRELAAGGGLAGRVPGLRLERSRLLADSPWRAVVHDRLRRQDGGRTGYAYLAVPRAVFVVPVTDAGELVLVRQYRHPVRDWTLEVPAGSVEDGEPPLDAARRELLEEVGGRAADWRHLGSFYSSSAHLSLRSDAYLATEVVLGRSSPELGEELATVRVPAGEAIARARAGGFVEGQTALAILLAAPYL